MKKALVLSTIAAAAGLAAVPASAMDILARVISSTPVVQQVAVPRQDVHGGGGHGGKACGRGDGGKDECFFHV